MTEPRDPAPQSSVTRLLLKAVKGLPEEEERVVLEHLVERGIGLPDAASAEPPTDDVVHVQRSWRSAVMSEPRTMASMFMAQKAVGPDQIMIPVRLSEDQHRQLKEWCAEHNFPMAVVVRGLVERFLDSWEKRSA